MAVKIRILSMPACLGAILVLVVSPLEAAPHADLHATKSSSAQSSPDQAKPVPATQAKAIVFASQDQERRAEFAEPDNAGNRSLPLIKLTRLTGAKKGAEALSLLSTIKPTAYNRNLLHIWKGLAYRCQGNPEEAVIEFDQCTDFAETSIDGQRKVAETYLKVGQEGKAFKILNAVLDKALFVSCLDQRGDCNLSCGRSKEAVADYSAAAKIHPERARILACKGAEILLRDHKCREALTLLNDIPATKEQLDDGPYYVCRAICQEAFGHWQEATQDLTAAIRLFQSPGNIGRYAQGFVASKAYPERAKCYDHLGKAALAAADRLTYQKLCRQAEVDVLGPSK